MDQKANSFLNNELAFFISKKEDNLLLIFLSGRKVAVGHLTTRKTIDKFIAKHNATLTVMHDGEHWFHTHEQTEFLNKWMKKAIGL